MQRKKGALARAFTGLALGLTLSLINLAGAFVALLTFGGLAEWSRPQFVGLFGILEVATGVVSVFGPNIWRLPVAEAQTSEATGVKVALSTLAIPHLGASAKALAGLGMVLYACVSEGVSPASAGLPLLAALLAVAVGTSTLAMTRFGVARPDLDVWALTIRRARHEDRPLPAFSITSLFVLFIVNIGIFPAVKLLSPDVLFQPEMAPSAALLAWVAGIAAVSTLLAVAVWWGRLAVHAPAEQQREAEAAAEGAIGDLSNSRTAEAS